MFQSKSFPNGSFTLFGSEFTARFCFWAIQSSLVLYLTNQFHYSDAAAYAVLASYSALTYATTFLGGLLADKYFGAFRVLLIGMAISAVGMFMLLMAEQQICFAGLGLLIMGMGLYVPANAALLDNLYQKEDPLRDRGYFYLYVATNLGGIFGPLCLGFLAQYHSFEAGFLLCGILLLLSLWAYFLARKRIVFLQAPDRHVRALSQSNLLRFWMIMTFLTTVICILLCTGSGGLPFLSIAALFALSYFVYYGRFESNAVRKNICIILLFSLLSLLFFAMEFQLLNSIITFTRDYVDKDIKFFSLPASFFAALQAFFIVLMAPVIQWVFEKLERHHVLFTNTHKFALGFLFMSLSFFVLSAAAQSYHDTLQLLSPWWLVSSTLLMSTGEILLMPVLLSLVTKESPENMKNAMVGFLYFCLAFASYLSGWMAKLVSVIESESPVMSYQTVYWRTFIFSMLVSVLLLLVNRIGTARARREEGAV